ncbi:hypothetical protein GR183_08295 [Stappia sp. GBMRC 2046]|uniref:TolB amino-terminal domain-containing protein n=1 Tax=Stappia sediminis TaxID=2692190 RepID=A0A7X3S7M9_9HYPH|nr:tetratricopeptide repeat protein [Stappia sediminis]MXN64905.1 hypothetical protein [Stappia sediminis]
MEEELRRILSNPEFQASAKRRAFLRFIVEEALAGRAARLKGHAVAVAVFGRDETFDSQSDPVVRLEARRLRRDLDCYYVEAGSHNPVRISIPKGSYVPRFEWHEPVQAADTSRGGETEPGGSYAQSEAPGAISHSPSGARLSMKSLVVAFALIAALGAAVAAGWYLTAGKENVVAGSYANEPAIVVLPFEALTRDEDNNHLAEGIRQELIGDLMRFAGFRVYSPPVGGEKAATAEPVKLARDLGVAYVVTGSLRTGPGELHVATRMFDAATGQVLWSGTYNRALTPESLIRVQDDLAGEIASVLGQPYGVVAGDLKLRAATPAVSSMKSYMCVRRAYGYRRGFSRAEFEPVLGCLEEAVRRDPAYSDAWAMLGWLHLDAGRFEFFGADKLQDEYQKGFQAASKALVLEPDNTLALKALSSINHYMGHYEEGERLARRAVELNPHDPDTLAQLGWRLAVRGNFDEGIPILNRAIERTVNPPGWYFHLIAVDLLLKGDFERMLQVAQRSAVNGSAVSQVLIAIAATELGQRDTAKAALEELPESGPIARDAKAFFRRHGSTDEIVDAIEAGLAKARQAASTPED